MIDWNYIHSFWGDVGTFALTGGAIICGILLSGAIVGTLFWWMEKR